MPQIMLGPRPGRSEVPLALALGAAGALLAVAIVGGLSGELALGRLRTFAALTIAVLAGLGVILGLWVEHLRALAVTDPLTGLFNRRFFRQRLAEEATRRPRGGSVATLLFIDLDHLKQVNDSLGHQAGDRALLAVAASVRRNVRTTDVVARVGGDEFNVILARTSLEAARVIAARIEASLAECTGPWHEPLSVSIGVSALRSGDRVTADEVIREADLALYRAKRARAASGAVTARR